MSSTSSHACSSRPAAGEQAQQALPEGAVGPGQADAQALQPATGGRRALDAGRERHLRLLLHLGRLEGVQTGDVLDPAGRGVARLRGVVPHARRVVTAGLRRLSAAALGRPSPGAQQPHDESDAGDRDDHGDGDDFLELAHSRRFSQRNPGAYDVSPGRRGWPGAAVGPVGGRVGGSPTWRGAGRRRGRPGRPRTPRGSSPAPGSAPARRVGVSTSRPSRRAGTATSPTTTMATPTQSSRPRIRATMPQGCLLRGDGSAARHAVAVTRFTRGLPNCHRPHGRHGAAADGAQALWTSRIRWETTVVTPSPRIVTP